MIKPGFIIKSLRSRVLFSLFDHKNRTNNFNVLTQEKRSLNGWFVSSVHAI